MGYINLPTPPPPAHECPVPDIYRGGLNFIPKLKNPIGTVWQCDDCGRIWRLQTKQYRGVYQPQPYWGQITRDTLKWLENRGTEQV